MSVSLHAWAPTYGMHSRTRRIDQETAQAILDCRGHMGPSACARKFEHRGATVNIVQGIWRRKNWARLKPTEANEQDA